LVLRPRVFAVIFETACSFAQPHDSCLYVYYLPTWHCTVKIANQICQPYRHFSEFHSITATIFYRLVRNSQLSPTTLYSAILSTSFSHLIRCPIIVAAIHIHSSSTFTSISLGFAVCDRVLRHVHPPISAFWHRT
jgi:hypothetical protein